MRHFVSAVDSLPVLLVTRENRKAEGVEKKAEKRRGKKETSQLFSISDRIHR